VTNQPKSPSYLFEGHNRLNISLTGFFVVAPFFVSATSTNDLVSALLKKQSCLILFGGIAIRVRQQIKTIIVPTHLVYSDERTFFVTSPVIVLITVWLQKYFSQQKYLFCSFDPLQFCI